MALQQSAVPGDQMALTDRVNRLVVITDLLLTKYAANLWYLK
jgi:hypothetical protein